MTREEAITIIGNLEDKDIFYNPCDVQDAKTMAIKALEQEPCNTDTCKVVSAYMNEWDKPNNFDAISKQAVMDCIDAYSSMIIRPLKLKDYIDKLPPVNPQPICEEREKGECPYYAG